MRTSTYSIAVLIPVSYTHLDVYKRQQFRVTTDSKHSKTIHSNHLARQFNASVVNERWVSDIPYVQTKEGWLYLAVVMDLFSRKIVGWSMLNRVKECLVIDALKMALFRRKISNGLLLHSDRGSQYAGDHFQQLLRDNGILCSMSRKGNCWDNSAMESFFHSLKTECIYQDVYKRQVKMMCNDGRVDRGSLTRSPLQNRT